MSATSPPLHEDEIKELVRALGQPEPSLTEYTPRDTIRTFRAGELVVRVDTDPAGTAIATEARALRVLDTAAQRAIAPKLIDEGSRAFGGVERAWLAYGFVAGHTLNLEEAQANPAAAGELFGTLHAARVFDLRAHFDRRADADGSRSMTLMEAFKRTSDRLRQWMLAREADGLAQDLLTLTLGDLQGAMREWAMAMDHLFLTARRRVLCHGSAEPATVVADEAGALHFVSLDRASLGDAAEDLASFSLAARLDEGRERTLLFTYAERLADLGRDDPRLIPRYFARRSMLLLERPVARLDRLRQLKSGELAVIGDAVAFLEDEAERCYDDLVDGINGLRALAGSMRPIARREVCAMGRLIAFEELLLAGRSFRIALTGLPYAGKTEVGSAVARRLDHAYVNTSALSRALALHERRLTEARGDDDDAPAPRDLPRLVFEAGLSMRAIAEPPFYEVKIGGSDVTLELHSGVDQLRGAALLDDEEVRGALRDELSRRFLVEGLIVEGHFAPELVSGRARAFHLSSDRSVRRARLRDHRADIESDEDAEELLGRLDDSTAAPAAGEETTTIDLGSRHAAAAALEILLHLLPESRRTRALGGDMSGRSPLYP